MNMALKYIVYDNGMFDEIVVFTDSNDHNNFRLKLGIKLEDVISAGFISVSVDGPYCYGRSTSLDRLSRCDVDTALLTRFMTR